MKMFSQWLCIATLAVALIQSPAQAVDKTAISGAFSGCEYDKTYDLMDGRTLTCRSYGYHYAYSPTVYIVDGYTVLIDGEEYSAIVD